jgi:SAM-dependent methyltransferase
VPIVRLAEARFATGDETREHVQSVINAELLAGNRPLRVLEAGCGSLSYVNFGDEAHIVGIDIDAVALERNKHIDESILGDVETYDFQPDAYDAVVCWYVFEHLKNPVAALVRFAHAAKPGGLIVVAFPNLMSPKGLVTKFSPFWFHVAFRRYVLGRKNAGKPGHAPYPTTLPFAMAPEPLISVAEAAGLEVAYAGLFEDDKQEQFRRQLRLVGSPWNWIVRAVAALSGGRLDADHTEVVLAFRKRLPAAATADQRQPAAS